MPPSSIIFADRPMGGHKYAPEGQQGGGQHAPPPSNKRLRVWERWEGNEKFFCGGYLITGPNWRPVIGSIFVLVAPVVIYLTFVASYMTLQRSAAIMVFSCILPVLALLFLFMTSCIDPGIIPRRQPDEEYLQGRKPRTKEVIVNNQRVMTRYNDTCHFYQPPRAHHCSVNDNCIERFDHHCPWVGTTVGARNYRFFLLFIYTATVLCCYAFGNSLASLFVRHSQLVDEAQARGESGDDKWGETIGDTVPAIVIMAYTFLLFWFVGGLSGFHAYLVATNQTTYETFRYRHDNRPNPYNKGILANCAEVWCTPLQPSKVNFRAFVDEVEEQTGDFVEGNYVPVDVEMGRQQAQQAQQQANASAATAAAPVDVEVGRQQAQQAQQQANASTATAAAPPPADSGSAEGTNAAAGVAFQPNNHPLSPLRLTPEEQQGSPLSMHTPQTGTNDRNEARESEGTGTVEISLEEKLENDRQAVQGGIEGRLPSSDASPEGKVTGPEDGAARGDEVEGQQQQQEYRGTTSQGLSQAHVEQNENKDMQGLSGGESPKSAHSAREGFSVGSGPEGSL